MGYVIVILLIVGDLWLYLRGGRPEHTIWPEDKIRWM